MKSLSLYGHSNILVVVDMVSGLAPPIITMNTLPGHKNYLDVTFAKRSSSAMNRGCV